MIGNVFINEVFSRAIELYLKYKDKPNEPEYHRFLVMAIRTLVSIYGELDIINPYITQNEHNMGGFDSNLTKFGFPKSDLEDFKNQFLIFFEEAKNAKVPNSGFVQIEKYFIDMFFCKKKSMNLSDEDVLKFQEYLYIPSNTDPYIQNDMNRFLSDKNVLALYFESKQFESEHEFTLEEVQRDILSADAYQVLGYSMEQVYNFTDQDLQAVNGRVYQFFHVNPMEPNKAELLDKAVNYYKRYGNRVTTGNGYVDFLLFASVLATAVFITTLFVLGYL